MYYILDGKQPVHVTDVERWAVWFAAPENRRVAQTAVGPVTISTVFLGIDHNFSRSGAPVLFETMVFGGPLDGAQQRYRTFDEAAVGHEDMVRQVRDEPTSDIELDFIDPLPVR